MIQATDVAIAGAIPALSQNVALEQWLVDLTFNQIIRGSIPRALRCLNGTRRR